MYPLRMDYDIDTEWKQYAELVGTTPTELIELQKPQRAFRWRDQEYKETVFKKNKIYW